MQTSRTERTVRIGVCVLALGALVHCVPPGAQDSVDEQRAALRARDGDRTVTTPEVINHYGVLAVDASAGSQRLILRELEALPGLQAGDLVFVLQVQGATVDQFLNEPKYGQIISLGSAGRYELLEVTAVDAPQQAIQVRGRGAGGGLRFGYLAAGHTQVLRVPQYRTLTIAPTGILTAPAWNGSTGGVVAVVADTVQVDGLITAAGKGFRGGRAQGGSATNYVFFHTTDSDLAAERGEGVAGAAADYDTDGGRYGRGAAANGGGGGNSRRAAGGGGANGTAAGKTWSGLGVMDGSTADLLTAWGLDPDYKATGNKLADSAGGGRGGYGCSSSAGDPLTTGPGGPTWGCSNRAAVGGLGGWPLPGDVRARLFFGGGGGAGAQDGSGGGGGGGSGGGLIYVLAQSVRGTGRISAAGAPGAPAGGVAGAADAPGGGGGGGTVVLLTPEGLGGVQLSVAGGAGGNHIAPTVSDEATGGGGGGGGGYLVLLGNSQAMIDSAGGQSGITTQPLFNKAPNNGATAGGAGALTALAEFDPELLPPVHAVDLQITLGIGPTQRPGYTTAPLHATVKNRGPETAEDAQIVITLPETMLGRPVPVIDTTELSCTIPGSTIVCTLKSLAPDAVLDLQVNVGIPRDPQGPFTIGGEVRGGGFEVTRSDNQVTLDGEVVGYVHLAAGGINLGCSAAPGHTGPAGTGGLLGLLVLLGLRRPRRPGARGRWIAWVALLGCAGLGGGLLGCSVTPPASPVLQVQVTGGGTVQSEDSAIDCGTRCETSALPGARLRLTATPSSGERFVRWDGRCQGAEPECDVTLLTDTAVSATFAELVPSCADGVKNQDETDVDCGGRCQPCNKDNQPCQSTSDCVVGQCIAGMCTYCELDNNLVRNGGAEAGPSTDDYTKAVAIPNWTVTDKLTVLSYGAPGFPGSNFPNQLPLPPLSTRGQNFFAGGDPPGPLSPPDTSNRATQSINLQACAALIDTGNINFRLFAYLGGFDTQGDHATVRVRFIDGQDQTMGSAQIGPVSVTDRNNMTGLLPQATNAAVPPGSRRAIVTLTCTRQFGGSNDGYADAIALSLSLAP
jgi:Divergent InlB B-repeat domain